jgi:hypothetical protein
MIRVRRRRLFTCCQVSKKLTDQDYKSSASNFDLGGSEKWHFGGSKTGVFWSINHGVFFWKNHGFSSKNSDFRPQNHIYIKGRITPKTRIFFATYTRTLDHLRVDADPWENPIFCKKTPFFCKKTRFFQKKSQKKVAKKWGFFPCFFMIFWSKIDTPQQLNIYYFFSIPGSKKRGLFFDTPQVFIRPPGPMRVRSVSKMGPEEKRIIW